jgi:hypothetical protein
VNRKPVLRLWAVVVGKVWEVKEQRRKMRKDETVDIYLLHRAGPARYTDEGLGALSGESPIRPESVQKYLESKFGDALEDVSNAMPYLARSLPPSELAEKAYALYEKFRPEICPLAVALPPYPLAYGIGRQNPYPVPSGFPQIRPHQSAEVSPMLTIWASSKLFLMIFIDNMILV